MRLNEGSDVCADPCMHDWYESCRLGSKPGPAGLYNTQMKGLNYGFVNKFPSSWENKLPFPSCSHNRDHETFPKSGVIKC